MKIGDRIRSRREELKMSQEELARRLGYKSRSSINKIERDASGLPQTKIVDIARALSTTPSFIMGWEDEGEKKNNEMTIGNLFEYLRKQRELSISEFSAEIGLTEEEIRGYETSKDGIPFDIVKMLAEYFDISLEKLTTRQVKMKDIFAAFASTNEAYVQQMSKWVEIFGDERFSDVEFEKLVDYGKFIISQRRK